MNRLSLNIQNTKAILIGVSKYEHLRPIGPAIHNVNDVEEALADIKILGLPKKNITKILNKRNDEIRIAINNFFANNENIDVETLIFYYVGHGIRESYSSNLFIAGVNTHNDALVESAVRFDTIKQCMELSQVQHRIIILDCCYAGLATQDGEGFLLKNETDINGSYILTASASDQQAYFDTGIRNTFFTKELLNIVKKGIPSKEPYIALEDIYSNLKKNLTHSTPQRKHNLNTQTFNLFYNLQYARSNVVSTNQPLKLPIDGVWNIEGATGKSPGEIDKTTEQQIRDKIKWEELVKREEDKRKSRRYMIYSCLFLVICWLIAWLLGFPK